MIEKVIIKDNNDVPYHYVSELKAFENGREFAFQTGVNIIIGENGSGKSTLMDIISQYTFCHNSMCTEFTGEALEFPSIFDNFRHRFHGGVEVHCDYLNKVYRYRPYKDMGKDESMKDLDSFMLTYDGMNSSAGEQSMEALGMLFKTMNEDIDHKFPHKKIKSTYENANDVWQSLIKSYIDYIRRNAITLTEQNREITVLLDEPDRNLDITNIEHIFNILNFHRPYTQVIACIHNPILIYKLSLLEDVNIVEMEKGYLNKVKKFVKWGLKN